MSQASSNQPSGVSADSASVAPHAGQVQTQSLATIADDKIGTVSDADVELRKKVASYLLILFIGTNVAVAIVVATMAYVDHSIGNEIVSRATTQPAVFEKLIASADVLDKSRAINSNVVMALIGATTVQVGTGVWTITQYLFPKKTQPTQPT